MQIGDAVVYTDEVARKHNAVVTQTWGPAGPNGMPSINLIYVSGDEAKTDRYGRQVERVPSVVHTDNQSAHGRFYEVA